MLRFGAGVRGWEQVGCSSYLTPGRTQGFGPHYDDAEIFVCQLVGEKWWRLYDRPDADSSPRTTRVTQVDPNDLGDPVMEFTLKAGDVMCVMIAASSQLRWWCHCHSPVVEA